MFNMRGKPHVGASVLAMAVITAFLGAVSALPITETPQAAAATDSWPAMTLVYQVQGKYRGLNAPADTKIWKLSYQNERKWRKELMDSSADPREVGTIYSFEGTTYSVYSSVVKQTVHTGQYPDAPMSPERWFFPGLDRALEGIGYTKRAEADGKRVRYVKTETLPCEPDNPGIGRQATGITQPASCGLSPTYRSTETIIYRGDLAVPVEVITQLEGETVQHVVVTQLTTP